MKFLSLFLIVFLTLLIACKQRSEEVYVCPPCDASCDSITFNKPGICPHCNMELVKQSSIIDISKLVLNEIELKTGSGAFVIEGGKHRTDKTIPVYYHLPEHFNNESKILMVIPGAGRNGDSYRDAWGEESEKYNVLILAPEYKEDLYPFEDYHLCGLLKESNIMETIEFSDISNIARLDEERFNFEINNQSEEWLFHDFDRIFDHVVNAMGYTQENYDLFGHSAGGQILHRMALFAEETKAATLIAGNSGFYTLPDSTKEMPFGMMGMDIGENQLEKAFSRKLVLLIGEEDNAEETGGTLLRSPTADKQGYHRLERGQYFYKFSKNKAEEIGVPFEWELEIVSGVGHDHELMGNRAAEILYE